MGEHVGVVSELWRYPVKSMRGQRQDSVRVEERGVVGDRLYAVRDRDGKLASGKSTRRFRRFEGMLGFQAGDEDGVLTITLPEGRQIRADDDGVHRELQQELSNPDVTLAREQPVSHFDASPLHILTDASLARLAAALPGAGIDVRRFRPNLLVRTDREPEFLEDDWIGRTAHIGDEVVIAFTQQTERCVMVNSAQADLDANSKILRALSDANALNFGVYANVVHGGVISLGDPVRLSN